jgi:hypothetical protein
LETGFFLLFAPEGWKPSFFWGNNLEWPTSTINYLFILIFCKTVFFLHSRHMNVKLISQNFHRFWSMTSNPKSPNTCNFQGCPKLETPKFQHWQFFISHLNVNFFPLKHPAQFHRVGFFKVQSFIWFACTFVKVGPSYFEVWQFCSIVN